MPVTVLPIELIYFKANVDNGKVNLSWSTATEKNNDYFTVERSSNGRNFEKVLTQKGAGNSTVTRYYSAVDNSPQKGVSYYRLKQTDYNGQFTYSDIKSVMINDDKEASIIEIKSVSPTLFRDNFKVNFTSMNEGIVDFKLMSISGHLIASDKIQMQQGMNSYNYRTEQNLQSGIYFVILIYDDNKVSYKVVKE